MSAEPYFSSSAGLVLLISSSVIIVPTLVGLLSVTGRTHGLVPPEFEKTVSGALGLEGISQLHLCASGAVVVLIGMALSIYLGLMPSLSDG